MSNNTIKFDTKVHLLTFAISGLFFLCSVICLSMLSYVLRWPLTQAPFWLAGLLTLGFVVLVARRFDRPGFVKTSMRIFGSLAITFAICLSAASAVIDLSYDGQGYHQATMVALEKGWNPYTEDIHDKKDFKSQNTLWVESYPNANHIIAMNLFKVTGNSEAGKGVTLFLIIISCIVCYLALVRVGVHRLLSGLLAAVIVLNPINLLQMFTFGLDSQYYSLAVIAIGLGILIAQNYHRYLSYVGLVTALVMLVNNKLTSFVAAVIIVACLWLYLLWQRQFKELGQAAIVTTAAITFAILAIGYHPFVTNYLHHHHPLYPVYVASGSRDVPYDFSENRPSNYVHENQVSLFFKSLFFASNGNFRPPEDAASLKLPFTFTKSEAHSFLFLGPKAGGFGVLFSGIIVTLVLLLLAVALRWRASRVPVKQPLLVGAALLVVIASCLINPLSSVARYVPQLWLVIPLVMWLSWYYKSKLVIALNVLAVLLVAVNAVIVLNTTSSYSVEKTVALHDRLHVLARRSAAEPLKVNFAQSEGNRFLLERFNVRYSEDLGDSSRFNCAADQRRELLFSGFGNSTALVCLK